MPDILHFVIDFTTNIDKYIALIIAEYGLLIYLVFFLLVFCETGLVVTPFLPGDSLLFAAGAFAAAGSLYLPALFIIFSTAAVLGNMANYFIGRAIGEKACRSKKTRFINPEHIEKGRVFFDRHGGKAVVIGRFIPVIRTYVPFICGASKMDYPKYTAYNVAGSLLWVLLLSSAGFFFGNLPLIRDHFTAAIYIIIAVSLLPALTGLCRRKKNRG